MPKYFTFAEMVHTEQKSDNTPGWAEIENLKRLGEFLDTIRVEFGKAIRVNCAFRSAAVNAAVGGVSTSSHLKGLAADICAYSGKEADNRALIAVLEKKLDSLDQLITYHKTAGKRDTAVRFIHVGLSAGTPRKQRLYK